MVESFLMDENGYVRLVPDTSGMSYPVRCGICGHIHDSGKVEIVARYTDCDMWKCPRCGGLQDNRWELKTSSTAKKLY